MICVVCIFQLFLLPPALVDAWPGGPHQLICPIRLILQEDFLLCMHKRMEDILHEAEAIADIMAPGVAPGSLQGQLLLLLVSHAFTCVNTQLKALLLSLSLSYVSCQPDSCPPTRLPSCHAHV